MRVNDRTKRAMAVSSAMIDAAAAQVQMLSEDACLTAHEASALDMFARGIRGVAEELFIRSQPARKPRA